MAETVKRAHYYHTNADNKPGEGARILGALRDEGVNLLAFHAFPEGNLSQLDLIPEDPHKLEAAAQSKGIQLSQRKTVFLVQGEDHIGACADVLSKLANAKVNVIAMDAVATGAGQYGGLIWVSPDEVELAAQALGA